MTALHWSNPAGLWALLAVAVAAALYLFHRRYRTVEISGLFLWGVPERGVSGGRRVQPPRVSRAMLFDLLAALFLGLALGGPVWLTGGGLPAVVILDDGFGMRSRSTHVQARAIAERLARDGAGIIAAGDRPRQLFGPETSPAEAMRLVADYEPAADSVDLPAALRLAIQIYGREVDLHVITNRTEIPAAPHGTRLTLHRLAGRGTNLAFGTVWREMLDDGRERITYSVINHSDRDAECIVTIGDGTDGEAETTVLLPPGIERYAEFMVTGHSRLPLLLTIKGGEDCIAEDSTAWVAPLRNEPVTYAVQDVDAGSTIYFQLALEAAGARPLPASSTHGAADILVTGSPVGTGRFTLEVPLPDHPGVYLPPVLVDNAEPLCRDVDLAEMPWTVATRAVPDTVEKIYIMAGTTPLLWRSAAARYHLNLYAASSDVVRSPAWPALLSNLVAEASRFLPGPDRRTYFPGETVQYTFDMEDSDGIFRIVDSSGELIAVGGGVRAPSLPGLYAILTEDDVRTEIAVLPHFPTASDTTGLASESANIVLGAASERLRGFDLTWLLLLAAMLCITLNWRRAVRLSES